MARSLRRLGNDAEATFEYHMLHGIQGKVLDPKDGATLYDYFAEFGITPAAEVNFDLAATKPASDALRKKCHALIESVEDSFGGVAFRRYCGNAAFGVPPDKAFFYPKGVEGLFEIDYAPVDTFETVNTLGLPIYARQLARPDRSAIDAKTEASILPLNKRPRLAVRIFSSN